MSEEKDVFKSIKVYKFNNTKGKWHEFALKFRVIADTRRHIIHYCAECCLTRITEWRPEKGLGKARKKVESEDKRRQS